MVASQNILILTSNTGGGHHSAANALANSFTNLDPGRILVKFTQVLEESHYITRKAADLYNYLLRDHQDWMRYYYWTINKLKPNESRLIFKAAMGYGLRVFEKFCPNLLVSVHPMTQHFFAYLLRRLNLKDRIPLITVVTDPCYGFWRGWACDDVQQYYVASDEAKQQLIDYGVGSHKIKVFGMPVHSRFYPCELDEKRALRERMGLHPDKFTLFVNAGWIGGGNIPNIYESLVTSGMDMNIQTVFLAGNNERLLQDAHEMASAAPFPVKVLGYTDEIERLMNASDVMVSKLGGLTTFEALACRLPIIADTITMPMPQEAQTAHYIDRTGTGILLKQPDQIVSVVKSLIESPERYQSLCEATRLHGKVNASDNIAQDVLRYLNPSSN